MRKEIVGCGLGGQGIQLMVKVLALALHNKGQNVAYKEDYGPEVRGGRSAGYLVVKESLESWPGITEPDVLIALSQTGFDFWLNRTKNNALVFYDPALIQAGQEQGNEEPRGKREYYIIPASEIARELGDKRVVNMAMLGGVAKVTEMVSIEDIVEALKQEGKFSVLNQEALGQGHERVCKKA